MKKIILGLLVILFGSGLYGQISRGGEPLSFKYPQLKAGIATFKTPDFDYGKMILEDEQSGNDKPYRYGKEHQVVLNPENAGTWQTVSNGDKIWQLRITSSGAYSLSLIFNNFHLINGAKIFLYSPDKKMIRGAFTEKNNKKNGWFSTAPVAGEEMILELDVPASKDYGKLNISGVIHDYKGTFGLKSSGPCNVNINCLEGAAWQNEKRAVVKMTFSGYLCTGALVNNTARNAKPYLLTAEHCISNASTAATAVFIFNYESPTCDNINPTTDSSITSADLIATGNTLDFTLLELSSPPPYGYHAYYAGWNRKATPATNTTCIHHPAGDIKKISLDNDPPVIGNYGSGYVTNSHWNILQWDVGTTEGGSSGSPLFDQNHLIVGNLTGGQASCDYNYDDYFARFDLSWDYFPEAGKQLKIWLDPLNSGVETLGGFEPVVTDGLDAALTEIVDPVGGYCDGTPLSPQVVVTNNGSTTISSMTINYSINGGTVVQYPWNGTLTTLESVTITFDPVSLPVGDYTFKSYVSEPNSPIAIDLNHTNDTISSTFVVASVIDAMLSSIIQPNGAYCTFDSISPVVEIKNAGVVGITKLNINYQIDGGNVVTEAWYGNLQSGQSEIVTLKKMKLPSGKYDFKAYVSGINCGIDNDYSNDTLVAQFDGQDIIEDAIFDGPSEICSGALEATYSSSVVSSYLWEVQGGEISGADTLQHINVTWDNWGDRTIDLRASNKCNSVKSEALVVNMVEHTLTLQVEVGSNGASVCWSIENCVGEVLMEECGLASNTTYKTKICLPKGCYVIKINSAASGVLSYTLSEQAYGQLITQGGAVSGELSTNFILNANSDLADVNIYPNPSSSELVIEAAFVELYQDASFAIYNLSGAKLTPSYVFDDRKVIDISKLPKGMYLIRVKSSYGNFTKKFLKP